MIGHRPASALLRSPMAAAIFRLTAASSRIASGDGFGANHPFCRCPAPFTPPFRDDFLSGNRLSPRNGGVNWGANWGVKGAGNRSGFSLTLGPAFDFDPFSYRRDRRS